MKLVRVAAFLAVMLPGCSKDAAVNVNPRYDYSIDQARYCFCPNGGKAVRLFVVADTIADAVWLSDGSHVSHGDWGAYRTIKGLYQEMSRWDTSAVAINVTYDSVYHYPALLSISPKPVVTPDSIVTVISDAEVAYKTYNYIRYGMMVRPAG
ncbi:MAG: DUF6174 domain-containing protein [Bacteroidetes bacterium]|nr:DUF6174 domain-containing protein [Bacteroidota bacterium]